MYNTVKMADVAEKAGVSLVTVTRVMNNSGYVSAATREKVQKAIDSLGYVINRSASTLKGQSSNILGIVAPSASLNPFFTIVFERLMKLASESGYNVLYLISDTNRESERTIIDDLISRMAEVIIFIGGVGLIEEDIQKIVNRRIPVIMIERPLNIHAIDKIYINDRRGSALVAEEFVGNGHTEIGYIGKRLVHFVERNRLEGFVSSLEETGIQLPDKSIYLNEYYLKSGYEGMKKLLKVNPNITAVYIASDILACGALQYLYEKKLRVPDDISVIGYDNTISAQISPAISSIAYPVDEICETTLKMFAERKNNNRENGRSVLLDPYLVDRGSVRDLRCGDLSS